MRRLALSLCAALCALLVAASPAVARVGLKTFEVSFLGPKGEAITQAGAHPYAMKVLLEANTVEEGGGIFPDELTRDLEVSQVEGFAGDPAAVPSCSALDFLTPHPGKSSVPDCADSSAIGIARLVLAGSGTSAKVTAPVYDLTPSPGFAAKLGFITQQVPVTIDIGLTQSAPYRIIAHTTNVSQILEFLSAELELWGVPADERHNEQRGICLTEPKGTCENANVGIAEVPFLTLPRACRGPLSSDFAVDSWLHPGARLPNGEANLADPNWVTGSALTHGEVAEPVGMSGCGALPFAAEASAVPSTRAASSASGLEVNLDATDEGILSPKEGAVAASDIEAVSVALPAGMTLDPSAAEGLGICTPGQFAAASVATPGCPDAAKLGEVEVETPILPEKVLRGSFYLGEQGVAGPGETGLRATVYLVIRDPDLGVVVAQQGEVRTDTSSGQIITSFAGLPQFPLSHVAVKLRSGPRAPLITPAACGTYATTAILTPYSGAAPLTSTSSFTIDAGPGGGPCPTGVPPFAPQFEAGTTSNSASRYSPFEMRITRTDAEADLTRFSSTLPPGVVGKIAGLDICSDAAIEAAKLRSGREELASPSCPASSQIGRVVAGAGVGPDLTYVGGSLYLSGPFGGDPLSVVAIVPAVAGPFDVGTVVTREALSLNPESGRVEVDGSHSDPIPHMLQGIPLSLRDLRVYVDRRRFTLNSTSCRPAATVASLWGSGSNPFSPADDAPVSASSRYKAADCASLGFAPKISLAFKGRTTRAAHPALHSTVTYPYPSGPGYANIGKAVVALPSTEFIDNAHISNPCTRVQFNAGKCPKTSVIGTAKATTPLLDKPLKGPVYFRSNGGERQLPDVVADLRGQFHIVLVGFVKTITPHTDPRLQTTFANVPDAPVSRFTLNLYGGKRGLLQNNTNLCARRRRAKIALTGHNGARRDSAPAISLPCKRRGKRGR